MKSRFFRMILAATVATLSLLTGTVWAIITNFTYTPATTWDNGDPILPGDIRSTRLYCNDTMVAGEPGDDGDFDPDLPDGAYTCYAIHTVVNNTGLSCRFPDLVEGDAVCLSDRSNEVTRVVGQQFAPVTEPPILD